MNWNLEMLVFEERGKPESPGANERTNNNLNLRMVSTPGSIWTRTTLVGGECSRHCGRWRKFMLITCDVAPAIFKFRCQGNLNCIQWVRVGACMFPMTQSRSSLENKWKWLIRRVVWGRVMWRQGSGWETLSLHLFFRWYFLLFSSFSWRLRWNWT